METSTSPKPGDYEAISLQEKDKLNSILEKIVTKAGVDYSYPEIQDIQSALSEILERIKTRINDRCVFSISRIELCGSMAEGTAMWKFDEWPSKQHFIEFDFLAVLQASCDINADCRECLCVHTLPANFELFDKYQDDLYTHSEGSKTKTEDSIDDLLESTDPFKAALTDAFKAETNQCLISSCSCLKVKYINGIMPHGIFEFEPASTYSNNQQGCGKCTVDRPTGTLRVKTSVEIGKLGTDCSLIFVWTSKAKTLCTRDSECLPKTESMDNLTIRIDFLPALEVFKSKEHSSCVAACSSSDLAFNPTSSEYEHYCFLVPKHCVLCDENQLKSTWRKSGCLAEIDTFVNKMSDKHRKCYQVLKCLNGIIYVLNSYHLKVSVLHHNSSCSDDGEDCAKCVFKVLDELMEAYKTKELKSLHSQSNLLKPVRSIYCNDVAERIDTLKKVMCSVLPDSESVSSFLDKVDNFLRY